MARALPCAVCHGRGRLLNSASQPTLDVEKQVVEGLNVHVSRFGGVLTVEYLGKLRGRGAPATCFQERPRLPDALAVDTARLGAHLPYCWATRAEAKVWADKWQEPLRAAYATRFAKSGRR